MVNKIWEHFFPSSAAFTSMFFMFFFFSNIYSILIIILHKKKRGFKSLWTVIIWKHDCSDFYSWNMAQVQLPTHSFLSYIVLMFHPDKWLLNIIVCLLVRWALLSTEQSGSGSNHRLFSGLLQQLPAKTQSCHTRCFLSTYLKKLLSHPTQSSIPTYSKL